MTCAGGVDSMMARVDAVTAATAPGKPFCGEVRGTKICRMDGLQKVLERSLLMRWNNSL